MINTRDILLGGCAVLMYITKCLNNSSLAQKQRFQLHCQKLLFFIDFEDSMKVLRGVNFEHAYLISAEGLEYSTTALY